MLSIKSSLRRAAPFLAVAALAAGCGGHGALSLAQLTSNQDAYVGKEVSTAGVVQEQTNADGSHYYVLADPQQDLVALRPASRVPGYRQLISAQPGPMPRRPSNIMTGQASAATTTSAMSKPFSTVLPTIAR